VTIKEEKICETLQHVAPGYTRKEWESFVRKLYEIYIKEKVWEKGTCVEETIILGPIYIRRDSQRFAEIKLGTVAWDGSAPAEELSESGNPSLCQAKCTLIN
jgi:hypothetical protein